MIIDRSKLLLSSNYKSMSLIALTTRGVEYINYKMSSQDITYSLLGVAHIFLSYPS